MEYMEYLTHSEKYWMNEISEQVYKETQIAIENGDTKVVVFPRMPLTYMMKWYIRRNNMYIMSMPKTVISRGLRAELWQQAIVMY